MATDFDKYAAKGNELLKMLAEDLDISTDKALRILRCVLYAIRDHLSLQESIQVVSQLPMAVKGIYVDRWATPHRVPRIHHVEEFLNEIRLYDKKLAGYDFGNDESARKAAEAVFRTLNYYLSEGEFEDIIAVMPAEIKKFIGGSIGHGSMVL